jgi:hypothetical protein
MDGIVASEGEGLEAFQEMVDQLVEGEDSHKTKFKGGCGSK